MGDSASILSASGSGRRLEQVPGATAGNLTQGFADLSAMAASFNEQLGIMWLLSCGFIVFLMQCGFALLEAGTVRIKNTKNILLKNVIDACVSTIAWWSVGYAFALGECGENGFIGYHNFFSADAASSSRPAYWASWFWNWAFSATAATVVSGSMAERARFRSYAIYTVFISALVYPVVVHWVWSESGWLSAKRRPSWNCGAANAVFEPLFTGTNGVMDFAGSGVVHMVGGGAALMGGWLLGPRLGRFTQEGHLVQFSNASAVHMTIGVFILWLGWYGFNAGSTQCFYNCMPVAAQVAVNTTLSTGAGGLTCLLWSIFSGSPGDISPLLNGILAGAVSITANCAMVQSYAAVIIGAIGACVYSLSSRLLTRLQIDDPVDAAPVHFFCGIWGVLAVGFFATETSTKAAYSYANDWGVFYGGSGKQLGMQVLGVVCIAAWVCSLSGLLFYTLRKIGWLRVSKDEEMEGLDITQGIGSGIGIHIPCLSWKH